MNSRKKTIEDRWMMHKKAEGTEDSQKEKPIKKAKKAGFENVDFADEMDFEEVWDDDEGVEVPVDEDDGPRDDAARLIGKSRKKLSDKGKQMKKLVKHLDKGNWYVSDEEKDPYADVYMYFLTLGYG